MTTSSSWRAAAALLSLAACGGTDPGSPAIDAATAPQLTGVYSCSIEAIADRVGCGSP